MQVFTEHLCYATAFILHFKLLLEYPLGLGDEFVEPEVALLLQEPRVGCLPMALPRRGALRLASHPIRDGRHIVGRLGVEGRELDVLLDAIEGR